MARSDLVNYRISLHWAIFQYSELDVKEQDEFSLLSLYPFLGHSPTPSFVTNFTTPPSEVSCSSRRIYHWIEYNKKYFWFRHFLIFENLFQKVRFQNSGSFLNQSKRMTNSEKLELINEKSYQGFEMRNTMRWVLREIEKWNEGWNMHNIGY